MDKKLLLSWRPVPCVVELKTLKAYGKSDRNWLALSKYNLKIPSEGWNCCYWQKKDERRRRSRRKKNRKNHFRYWTFGVRAAHKYSYTPSNHTQAFQAPSHTCLRTNWILWLFWNMRTKYIPFLSLHFDASFVFCTYISMQLLQVGVIFLSMDYVGFFQWTAPIWDQRNDS